MATGEGRFADNQQVGTGVGAEDIAAADFDEDGRSDLIIASSLSGGSVSLLLTHGTDGFSFYSHSFGPSPVLVATSDFNGDRHADYAIVDEDNQDIHLRFGDGTGQFHQP